MPDYRLYFLDSRNHIRNAAVELRDCEDDEQAIRQAQGHTSGNAMELWQRARLVKRFEAEPSP